jgi:hypothetical protein
VEADTWTPVSSAGDPQATPRRFLMVSEFVPCGRGVCAAEEGHDGTCAQASGWDSFTEDANDAAFERGYAAGFDAALARTEAVSPAASKPRA